MKIRARFGKTIIFVVGGLVVTAMLGTSLLLAGQGAPPKAAARDA